MKTVLGSWALCGGRLQLSTNSQRDLTSTSPGGTPGPEPGPEQRQRKRLILALLCLLGAIVVVAIKNRAYLLPAEPAESTPSTTSSESQTAPVTSAVAPGNPRSNLASSAARGKAKSSTSGKKAKTEITEADTYTPSVSRRALPPLAVEVYAGGRPVPLQPKSPNAVRVDTSNGTEGKAASPSVSQEGTPGAVSAAERVRISPEALQVLAHPVDPNYPLLAREMKVQGAVVLDALIGRDGTIQNLKIVSGPTILANAAMEAVRQWRFKPYYQQGEAVETAARITVNFTISTT